MSARNIIVNLDDLKARARKSVERLKFLVLGLAMLLASAFLILLLPKPSNLYVILLDTSSSMTDSMQNQSGGDSKIDAAKASISDFVGNLQKNDYYLLAALGDGKCNGRGLEWITSHREQNAGRIFVDINNNHEALLEILPAIKAEGYTHLSEGIFKTLNHIEQSLSNHVDFKSIRMIILGDGHDDCKAVKSGSNVITQGWFFADKLTVSVIGIDVPADNPNVRTNFEVLAEDGNGQYRDVEYADGFYNELVDISGEKTDRIIMIVHIIVIVLVVLVALWVLKV